MDGLGELVRTRRLALGMKQTTLAQRAGISQGAISDIEKGRRVNLTRDLLTRLAAALDIPLGELLAADTATDDPTVLRLPEDVPPTFAQAFLWASRYLTPRQRDTVLRLVQSLAAEVEEAHQDAQRARRDLVEPLTEETRPVEQNGNHAQG